MLCFCLPPQAAASCKLHLCISLSVVQLWKVSMPSFCQGCPTSLEYNRTQNCILLSSRSCLYWLCSLFGYTVQNQNVSSTSASLLQKTSGNLLIKIPLYLNWPRISAGCLFEIYLSVLDPCLTHCQEGQSLAKVTGSFQPTYSSVSCVSEIVFWHCTRVWRWPLVFNQYPAAKPWPRAYHWFLVRTLYTAQCHIKVM